MNLVVDIGNSSIKTAVFNPGQHDTVSEQIFTDLEALIGSTLLQTFPDIERCIISSVNQDPGPFISLLGNRGITSFELGRDTALPFLNTYKTPETLGKDRIAAVAGAIALYPEQDLFVIDAGTALTLDLYSRSEGYLGGNISPGLQMRFRALHDYTARLPYVESHPEDFLIGSNTLMAIRSGVQNGMVFEIEGYLTKISKKYPQIAVILTGGDARFFDNKLKNVIFVVQNLTLVGLNFILDYNAKTL